MNPSDRLTPKGMTTHFRVGHMRGLLGAVLTAPLWLTGCAFGLPTPEIQIPSSAAQSACRQYAEALREGESRDAIISGLEKALATARAASDDVDAQPVAAAIDSVLTATVVGTNESVAAANDQVIAACNRAGVPLRME